VSVRVAGLVVADTAGPWEKAGFRVDGEMCRIGSVDVRLAGPEAGRGLTEWTLHGADCADLDGLPTTLAPDAPQERPAADRHSNDALAIDHVVAFTPDLDRTVGALERCGLALSRLREGPTPGGAMRQAFFRLGEVLLEVIEHPEGTRARARHDAPARLWGIAVLVESLERCAERLGDLLGSPRDAVQPGRRIATLRRDVGLSVPVAFITPAPRSPRD
jgi:hypothetical protein